MRTRSLQRCTAPALAAIAAASLAACTPSPEQLAAEHGATVSQYCTDCHSDAEREADLVLENPNLANPAADRAKWEAVLHKLSAGLMPPPGQPRPSDEDIASFVSYLETNLDATAAQPAGAPVRRLTRAAYGNAVRDLLGFPVDVEALLPADITSDGFDNVSDTLKTSPLLLERYLTVGLRVAAMAVGDTTLSPRGTEYRPRLDLSQNDWIEGLPYGTRGGLVVDHYFPTDAEYEIRPELWRATGSTVRGVEGFKEPFELQILLDGALVHSAQFGGIEDDTLSNHDIGSAVMQVAARLPVRLRVSAGLHSVGVTFVAKSFALEQKLLDPDRADLPIGNDGYGWPIVTRALVTGPYDSTGSGDTPTRTSHLHVPAERRRERYRMRRRDPRPLRAARLRPAARRSGSPNPARALCERQRQRPRLRGRHRGGPRANLERPRVPAVSRRHRGRSGCRNRQSGRRRHARVAARAIPLEQHSGRRAARGRHRGPAPRARNARSRSAQNAGRSARRHARHGLRRAMAGSCGSSMRRRPISARSRRSTTTCAATCCARPSCSCAPSCSRTRACSTCSAPTTRS